MAARIAPLSPPYPPELQASLEKWMPPGFGVEPLKLFRTIARHPLLSERMRGLGGALLGRGSLPLRTRELLILRTCARCDAAYEWGVHVAAFAAAAGLDEHAVESTIGRSAADIAASEDPEDAVLRLVDDLHDSANVDESTWAALSSKFEANALLEMLALVGFYHLISFVANGARVEPEAWAAGFPRRL